MIKVIKAAKPQILVDNAENWKNALLSFIANNGGTWKNAGTTPVLKKQRDSLVEKYRHDKVKIALENSNTQKKCVFCESNITVNAYYEIEHFYPKSLYPHLTFEWGNLFISCKKCNLKKLDHDTQLLPIVHPANDEPEDAFCYHLEHGKIEGLNEIAVRTIEKCDLERDDFLTDLKSTVENFREGLEDVLKYKVIDYENGGDKLAKAREIHRKLNYAKSCVEAPEIYVGLIRYLFRNSPTFQQAIMYVNNHQTDLGLSSPFVLF